MGIPSFFSYIIKSYPNIIKKLTYLQKKPNNLYLDSNSIIYDCMRLLENDQSFEDKLIQAICGKIDEYISIIKPDNTVIIAFDGVAPVAKLEQQRERRYKSLFTRKITSKISTERGIRWDQAAITPGTKFMSKLAEQISKYYKNREKEYGVQQIIVSPSNEIGEGEHKIFQYIRDNTSKHYNEITIIYGLDADLIMLCLNHLHISQNIYLFRETPEFIKSIDIRLIPNEKYILNIPLLATGVIETMAGDRYIQPEDRTKMLYDYIFMCFFLGNDFMPHFPSLNIRTTGILHLLNAYKETMEEGHFTDGKVIYWKNVREFVNYLAIQERDNLKTEYKVRERWERRTFSYNSEGDKSKRFLHIPIKNRSMEKYIDPYQYGWEMRYYEKLFEIDITDIYRKAICINYLEGMEWTFKYYTTGCIDWRWYYHYMYPPLLTDLVKYIPYWETSMFESNKHSAVSPYVQLAYVLPKESLHLLPKQIHIKLLKEKEDLYKTNCTFTWAFCKYFWESHPHLPHINLNELEKFINITVKEKGI